MRAGRVINKYMVAKHFDLNILDGAFGFAVNDRRVAAGATLDGLYVIRTSVAADDMSAEQAVLNWQKLAEAERAFRTRRAMPKWTGPAPTLREMRATASWLWLHCASPHCDHA